MEKKESEMNEGEILTLAQTFKDLIKIKNDEIIIFITKPFNSIFSIYSKYL